MKIISLTDERMAEIEQEIKEVAPFQEKLDNYKKKNIGRIEKIKNKSDCIDILAIIILVVIATLWFIFTWLIAAGLVITSTTNEIMLIGVPALVFAIILGIYRICSAKYIKNIDNYVNYVEKLEEEISRMSISVPSCYELLKQCKNNEIEILNIKCNLKGSVYESSLEITYRSLIDNIVSTSIVIANNFKMQEKFGIEDDEIDFNQLVVNKKYIEEIK